MEELAVMSIWHEGDFYFILFIECMEDGVRQMGKKLID